MGCRFPGGADRPEKLWQLLADGVDAVGRRRRTGAGTSMSCIDPRPGQPGKTYYDLWIVPVRRSGFDAGFFGISPREALAMDPQQRLLLETPGRRWSTPGIDPPRCAAAGPASSSAPAQDYGGCATDAAGGRSRAAADRQRDGVLSGRLAYSLGLHGPAVTVDTVCSSSLVALHLAAQSLRQASADLALVGGVDGDGTPADVRGVLRGSAAWPPTAAARRSQTPPTARAGARASACCCWSGCRRPGGAGTGCWPWWPGRR